MILKDYGDVAETAREVLNGETTELAWSQKDIVPVIKVLERNKVAVFGVDVWMENPQGDLEFAYVFPSSWTREASPSFLRDVEAMANEAIKATQKVHLIKNRTPFFSISPSVRRTSDDLLVVN